MIRRPPRSTLTYPLLPYTPLYRSRAAGCRAGEPGAPAIGRQPPADLALVRHGTGVAADHAAPADQPRIFAAFERPEAMAMFGLVTAHPVDPRCGRFDIERRAESRHDIGIAANPLKGRDRKSTRLNSSH